MGCMVNKRKSFSENTNIVLFNQVDGICPLCDTPLLYEKNGSTYKQYELAHIYPLNPTSEELTILANEERLSADVDHENNLIPLCKICHQQYDKPRTVAEYRNLVKIKKELIKKSEQKDLWHQYQIEKDILKIIDALYSEQPLDYDITFEPKEVDKKLNGSISNLTKHKIKNNVSNYYTFVKKGFASIDSENPGAADLISLQVKHYYLKQKQQGLSQQEIYTNIVDWIMVKTNPSSNEPADILASFFVQNCEVFE